MSDSAAPIDASTGAGIAGLAKDETTTEVAPAAAEVGKADKGKGKAPEPRQEQTNTEEEDDDEDDEDDEDDDDEDDDDDDDDLSIEADEVDPTNIEAYGIGNRPSRTRKNIDYSSEEALKKAGISTSHGDEEEEDRDFTADASMDG
ncbi:unnamed protein product [Parajaminaea phylloscopi]